MSGTRITNYTFTIGSLPGDATPTLLVFSKDGESTVIKKEQILNHSCGMRSVDGGPLLQTYSFKVEATYPDGDTIPENYHFPVATATAKRINAFLLFLSGNDADDADAGGSE